jgi:nitronate monooxygenase
MKIPNLDIGGLIAKLPIVQGAMGVGVSGSRLAAAVANEGGVGVIAVVGIGYREPDFIKNTLEANLRALRAEIRKARELSPKGILGVNLLVAINHYSEMVRVAVEEGIDLIISGAGIPMKLPEFVEGVKTRIAPIVSSSKSAKVILKYWDNHYNRTADMIVVEGPEAGGHLGYSEDLLKSDERPSVIDILKDVIETIKPFNEKYNKKIPVIAAGGIYTGMDIANCLNNGASGVQMATRFVATDECDADIEYKKAFVNSKKEDIRIIKSPVGMPGRALNNKFIQKVTDYGDEIKGCLQCLRGCNPKIAPYCISTALINAVKGNVDEGLIFVGSNAYRVDKITSVKELMNELKTEIESV